MKSKNQTQDNNVSNIINSLPVNEVNALSLTNTELMAGKKENQMINNVTGNQTIDQTINQSVTTNDTENQTITTSANEVGHVIEAPKSKKNVHKKRVKGNIVDSNGHNPDSLNAPKSDQPNLSPQVTSYLDYSEEHYDTKLKPMLSVKLFDIPFKIPYFAKAFTSSLTPITDPLTSELLKQVETRPVDPAHITQAKLIEQGKGNAKSLITALIKEALIHGTPGIDCKVHMGRVQVHNGVKPNSIYVSKHGIYINPLDAGCTMHDGNSYLRSVDGDGDIAFAIQIDETHAIFAKNPNAGLLRVMNIQFTLDRPKFMNLDSTKFKEAWLLAENAIIEDWVSNNRILSTYEMGKKIFDKCQTPTPVGIIDSSLKSSIMERMIGIDSLEIKQSMFPHPELFKYLERGGLKVARSDASKKSSLDAGSDLSRFDTRIESHYQWALTNTGRIGSQSFDNLKWTLVKNMGTIINDIINLNFKEDDFFSASERKEIRDENTRKRNEYLESAGYEPSDTFEDLKTAAYGYDIPEEPTDYGIIGRMINLKLLKTRVIKSDHCEVPSYLVWLEDGHGKSVGLTDIKSDDWKPDELTYCFILPPVWSVYHNKLVDPLWYMGFRLAPKYNKKNKLVDGVETHILNTSNGNIRTFLSPYNTQTGYFHETQTINGDEVKVPVAGLQLDLVNPRYAMKVQNLMKGITTHVSQFGIPAPAEIEDNGRPVPLRNHKKIVKDDDGNTSIKSISIAAYMARCTIIVDYASATLTTEQQWDIFKKIHFKDKSGTIRFLAPGSKGEDQRVRRYGIAHIDSPTLPLWANNENHSNWSTECIAYWQEKGIDITGLVLPTTNGRRSSQMFSQLSRSIKGEVLLVAVPIVTNDFGQTFKDLELFAEKYDWESFKNLMLTSGYGDNSKYGSHMGAYLSPSGRRKLKVPTVHFTDFVNEPTTGFDTQVSWADLKGSERVAWKRSGPKVTSNIGKIIDIWGNKMIPSPIGQCYIHNPDTSRITDQVPIDMIFPAEELLSKGCFLALCKDRQIQDININGQIIKCRVIEMEVSRTSGTTDNSPTITRNKWFRHSDAHMIASAVTEHMKTVPESIGSDIDTLNSFKVSVNPLWNSYCKPLLKIAKRFAIISELLTADDLINEVKSAKAKKAPPKEQVKS